MFVNGRNDELISFLHLSGTPLEGRYFFATKIPYGLSFQKNILILSRHFSRDKQYLVMDDSVIHPFRQ